MRALIQRNPILTLLTLVGFVLRAYGIGSNSLWMDEIRQVGYYYSTENVFHLIYKAATQQQPPLDYLIGYVIGLFLPFHEVVARLPSLVFGTLLIPLTYQLVSLIYNSRVALLTSIFVCFSPSLIYYSQEARPYSIFLVLLTWSLITYFKAMDSNSDTGWKRYRLASFLTLMSRGLEPILGLGSLFLTSMVMWKSIGTKNESPSTPPPQNLFKRYFRFTVTSGLWFLPFLLFIISKSRKYLAGGTGTETSSVSWASFSPFSHLWTALNQTLPQPTLGIFTLATLGLILCFIERKKHPRALFISVFFFVFMIVHTVVFHLSVNPELAGLAPKYVLYSHIPFLFLGSISISYLFGLFENFVGLAKTRRLVPVLVACLVVVFALSQLPKLKEVYRIHKVDYRSAGKYLKESLSYGDVIVHVSFLPMGHLEHGFWGEGLYYKTPAPTWGISEAVKAIKANPHRNNRIFVAVHEAPEEPINHSPHLTEFTANGIKLFHLDKSIISTNWGQELDRLIDELIPLFPKEGARAKLYLAKCQLLATTDEAQARQSFAAAQSLYPNLKFENDCN